MTAQLGLWKSVENCDSGVTFRPIHYLGSKFRLLDDIERVVDAVALDEGAVCDLFSGSGVVAARLAKRRRVVAVDIQEYSRVLCSALVDPAPLSAEITTEVIATARELENGCVAEALATLIEYERTCVNRADGGDLEPLCQLLEYGSLLAFEHGQGPARGKLASALGSAARHLRLTGASVNGEPALARYFGGVYFSYGQALGLQCALAAIRSLPAESRDTALAAVLGTASEVVTTVGNHFAQPIRPRDRAGRAKRTSVVNVARRRTRDALGSFARWLNRYASLPQGAKIHEAIRADYRDFLTSYDHELAVVYADPPYTRDHYSRFYHVLETLAVQDDPGVSTTRIGGRTRLSRGLYRAERHQSPFCIKSQAPGAFADLLSGVRRLDAPLILSYSPYDAGGRGRPRLMMVDELTCLARRVFRRVEVISTTAIAHSKLNAAHLNTSRPRDAEVLIVCVP